MRKISSKEVKETRKMLKDDWKKERLEEPSGPSQSLGDWTGTTGCYSGTWEQS